MINTINILTPQVNLKNAQINHSNKIAFGMIKGDGHSITGMARYAEGIHELRKQRPFFKFFPFFNPKPITEERGYTTWLKGEYKMAFCDIEEITKSLKKKYNRLWDKVHKDLNKNLNQSTGIGCTPKAFQR